MGNLVWHEWSRYVSVTASLCEWLLFGTRPAKLEPRMIRHCVGGLLWHPVSQVFLRLCGWDVACAWRSPVSGLHAALDQDELTLPYPDQTIQRKCLFRHYHRQGSRCAAHLHLYGDRDGCAGVPYSAAERDFNTAELHSEDSTVANAGLLCYIVLSGMQPTFIGR